MRCYFPGEGLVLLLHGSSSVGKKSIARKPGLQPFSCFYQSTDFYVSTESIASMAGVPMIRMSLGKRPPLDLLVLWNMKQRD